MPRKKNPNNNYFNQNVEDAVCAYLNSTDEIERNKHFKVIYPALCKIAEVWYHKVKFSYSDDDMEDIMAGCVAHLVENMHKFKCGQGTKAFSYYTVAAKFWYMIQNNKNYRYFQRNTPLSHMSDTWDVENSDADDYEKSENARLLFDFIAYCEYNFDKLFTEKHKPYARIILDSINDMHEIQDFRRRKLLQFIYRKGGVTESKKTVITKIINQMTSHLVLFRRRWITGDTSLELCVKNYLTKEEKQIVKDTVRLGTKNNGATNLARTFGVSVEIIMDYAKSLHNKSHLAQKHQC